MLQAGPWCFGENDKVVECDGKAQRTQRAGIFELAYWMRDDRRYCESKFFRSRIVRKRTQIESMHILYTCLTSRGTIWVYENSTLQHI